MHTTLQKIKRVYCWLRDYDAPTWATGLAIVAVIVPYALLFDALIDAIHKAPH